MINIKKFKLDNRYVKISMYVLAIIIAAITFEKIIDNFNIISKFLSTVKTILSPFIIGFFLAYILNPLLDFFEKKVFGRIKKLNNRGKLKRAVSLVITYLLTFTIIIWFISFLIPEIFKNIGSLFTAIPAYIRYIQDIITKFINEHPEWFEEVLAGNNLAVNNVLNDIGSWVMEKSATWTQTLNSMLNYFISGTMSIASTLLDLILGIIISIYILIDKEKFAIQSKKVLYTLFNQEIANKIMSVVHDSNYIFENFLIGKIIDSTIIGIICFFGLTIFRIPYTLLISLIVGITNMIPYFGPFIGAIPAIIITMAATIVTGGIWPTVIVLVFILALQQFDGNILGPKILGDSTGLNPFWIIFSITIGGALAGVIGMFLGVPVFAVIYTMFSKFINRKYNEKFKNIG